jgi:FtsP/CotA-like multicopper oxidase with cupredoxin domain
LNLKQFQVSVHPDLPDTRVWGYEPSGGPPPGRSTYLGPTLLAERGTPVEVTFNNQLPTTPLFPADPALVPSGAVDSRINTHLHGGRIGDTEDGNPFDAYGDQDGQPEVSPAGQPGPNSQIQSYANEQGGTLLWYHDHALGITRTNVYAGLAGGYLLTEPADSPHAVGNVPTALDSSGVPDPYNPGGNIPLHIPLVIQDKNLDDKGQLVYPYPWAPEFFGDTCLVNGKAFPYLQVQPRKYRFTFLNGSQSRFYNLRFNKPVSITQIGVELGPIESPTAVQSILIGPAERADMIVDFSNLAIGTKVVLADIVLPPGVISPTRPLGDCLQFRVVGPALTGPDPFAGPPLLPGWSAGSPTPRPGSPSTTSKVTLEEVLGRGGKPVMAVVNGAPFMQRNVQGQMTTPDEPFSTEIVKNGDTVEWLYLNLTADSHPFHTHLGHFEVIDRQPFDAVAYTQALTAARGNVPAGQRLDPKDYPEPVTLGPVVAAPAQEKGPKDTVIANPGEITRIRIKFDLPTVGPGTTTPAHYVYHCHILEHEENEMMRPLRIDPA